MRWTRQKYKDGTTKYEICFAWLPVHTDDKKTIWLEKYIVKSKYHHYNDGDARWLTLGEWSVESAEWTKNVYMDKLK